VPALGEPVRPAVLIMRLAQSDKCRGLGRSPKRYRSTLKPDEPEKGYPADWIEKRMRSIAIRDELTGEWQRRGIKEQKDFAILTAETSKAAFGLTPTQYQDLKGFQRENLRDHMTDLEVIFTMLGEAATTEIAPNRDAQGVVPNKAVAHDGGTIAGNARRQLEQKSGKKVVTRQNYLTNKSRPSLPSAQEEEL
jgi:DNA-damage-inducible protein D